MVNTNTQCLYCGNKPRGIDAGIDNKVFTIEEMKEKFNRVIMFWECEKCNKNNFFTVPWEPVFDKFIT